jgi:hypothetical protein
MATPLASRRNAWWGLLFAYGIAGLSLCTLNGDLASAGEERLTDRDYANCHNGCTDRADA